MDAVTYYFTSDVRRRGRPNDRPMDRPIAFPCTLQSLQYIRSYVYICLDHMHATMQVRAQHSIDTTLLLLMQENSKKVWDAWLDRISISTGCMASNASPALLLLHR